ncbi:hypothetical protein V6N13_016437 [Hibiscus sabdariffa]|uniref:Uncharacterized protein n=2 Tax=Hibiscus sabdariffa TaxID=183260 RepID=A0ABR2BGP3_9ROSI
MQGILKRNHSYHNQPKQGHRESNNHPPAVLQLNHFLAVHTDPPVVRNFVHGLNVCLRVLYHALVYSPECSSPMRIHVHIVAVINGFVTATFPFRFSLSLSLSLSLISTATFGFRFKFVFNRRAYAIASGLVISIAVGVASAPPKLKPATLMLASSSLYLFTSSLQDLQDTPVQQGNQSIVYAINNLHGKPS